jgi:hypothetical protein
VRLGMNWPPATAAAFASLATITCIESTRLPVMIMSHVTYYYTLYKRAVH